MVIVIINVIVRVFPYSLPTQIPAGRTPPLRSGKENTKNRLQKDNKYRKEQTALTRLIHARHPPRAQRRANQPLPRLHQRPPLPHQRLRGDPNQRQLPRRRRPAVWGVFVFPGLSGRACGLVIIFRFSNLFFSFFSHSSPSSISFQPLLSSDSRSH
jgi:hypothetical protein